MAVKLTYQTGIAATIQFISVTVLNFIGGLSSSIGQCVNGSGNCISNTALSIAYFLFLTICYGVLWLAGFAAQERRSKRIAVVLVLFESVVFLYGAYELKKHKTILSSITALVDALSGIWIIWLSSRIMRAKGGRVRVQPRNSKSPRLRHQP